MAHNFKINMKTNADKRTYERHGLCADLTFSYFNREPSYFAQTLNFGTGGMCFTSSVSLKPGATVNIHLKKIHQNSPGNCFCHGLRNVTLAEVKWCREVTGDKASRYAVGVKYFESIY